MLEDKQFKKKIHMTAKDREKQRKWRLQEDPDGDYENLDTFLTGRE
jgi:ribosomal protein RSM22 (predicted rRNA methylase)